MNVDGDRNVMGHVLTGDSVEKMVNAVQQNFSEIDKKARKCIDDDNKKNKEYGFALSNIDKNEDVHINMNRQGMFDMSYGDITGHSIILEFKAPNLFEFTSHSPYWFG